MKFYVYTWKLKMKYFLSVSKHYVPWLWNLHSTGIYDLPSSIYDLPSCIYIWQHVLLANYQMAFRKLQCKRKSTSSLVNSQISNKFYIFLVYKLVAKWNFVLRRLLWKAVKTISKEFRPVNYIHLWQLRLLFSKFLLLFMFSKSIVWEIIKTFEKWFGVVLAFSFREIYF